MNRGQRGCLTGMVILLAWVSVALADTVSEEARRYMARGVAATEMAKSSSDYALAVKEFEQAAQLAPDWPDIYYNLGSVYAKAGDITSAIKSFQRYLDLAPKSPDAAKIQEEVYKLVYRRDREKLATTLEGTWTGPNGQTFELKLDGSRLQLTRVLPGDDIFRLKAAGTTSTSPMLVPLVFSGTLVGDKISGQYLQAPPLNPEICDMPVRKGDFEGTVDVAAGQMHIVYNSVKLEFLMKFASFLSDKLVCSQTNRQETSGYVLKLKHRPQSPAQTGQSILDSEKASIASLLTGAYKGVRNYENGDKYEGEFTNRNLNGKGTYTYKDGDKYAGEFVDGEFNGKGTYTYANGDKYAGEFVNGKFTSKGTFICGNGKQFTGDLENKVPLEFTMRCPS